MTYLHKLAKRLALIPAALVVSFSFLASCSEGTPHEYLGPDPTKPNPAGSYIGLSIIPRDPQLIQGDSVRLEALGWLASGLSAPAAVTWSASGGTVTGSGWFRSTTVGSYRVRAVSTANSALSDSVLVTIIPSGGIARLDITPSAAPLAAGTRQQFTAVALMADGSRTFPTVIWSATGGSISPSGLFTASAGAGGYSITASMGSGAFLGMTAGLVDAAVLTGLSLDPDAVTMESGTVRQFVPRASWSDGSTTVPPLTWSATGGPVTTSGVYTAGTTPGSYRVIASSLGKADTSNVTILPRIIGIRVAPLTALLAFEATQAMTAYALRNDGTESPVGATWSAQGGTIGLDGLYTAGTTAGIYPVTGRLTALDGTVYTGTANLEVAADDATMVQLFVKPDTSVVTGSQVQFTATGTLADGSTVVPAMTWSATGGSIDSKGLYSAGSLTGNFKVIGKRKNGNKADTADVVIRSASVLAVSGLTVSPQADIIGAGQSRQFSATLTWNDGGVHPADISWVSAGGTITQNGLYTAGTVAGTFLVIATCGCGAADTASVTIPQAATVPVTLSQLVLSPPTVQLAPGTAQIFTVVGVWSDGAMSPPAVTFTATGGAITSAGAYTAGNVGGTYRVIATQAGGGLADTSIVTIPQGAATLTQLVLNPSAVTVPKGATQAFVVSASWSDGTSTVPPVTFNATGGTVSTDGVYTAGNTAGTYRIIVTHTGGTKADTSAITIPSAVTLNQLVLNPSTVNVAAGGTQQFVVSGLWSDGSTLAPTVTWTAGGGSITPAGLYTAGSVAGTYQVIARHSTGTKADTSAVTIGAAPPPLPSGGSAELPRVLLNTTYSAPAGAVISVPAGGNLQAALNSAQPGDQIVLAAGATYTGNYVLPPKSGCLTGGWIIVRGANVPPEGVRVSPAVAATFPKIVTPNVGAAIEATDGSCGWRIVAVEITGTAQSASVNYNYGPVKIGLNETTLSAIPHDIIFDRIYLHGTSSTSIQHGIMFNGIRLALIDSYVSEIHWPGTETHAVAGYSGPGPFKIVNNYLEAASVNLMFGGADPVIAGVHPSDIEIRRNYFFKPRSYRGMGFAAKNLLELKHAQRVLIEGNVFENSWSEAQEGMALNFQSSADANHAWPQTADITVRNNRILGVNVCAVILATDYFGQGIPLSRLTFENNWCDRVGGDQTYRGFLVGGSVKDVRIASNTVTMASATEGGSLFVEFNGAENFTFVDNVISPSGIYGPVFMSGGFIGSDALNRFAGSSWTFTGNVIAGVSGYVSDRLPAGNTWPATLSVNADGTVAGYPGKGANMTSVLSAISGVVP